MKGYENSRMKLSDVVEWLDRNGGGVLGSTMMNAFKYHTWTIDGMTRTDVIKEVLGEDIFRSMECEVITYINEIPLGIAHVD
jgi:hypothetical protein